MSTTTIYVEQVLIGSIVLAILGLPLVPEIAANQPAAGSVLASFGILASAVLLGLAYLLGIVFDRVADQICKSWERHLRARFAIRAKHAADARETRDPFDERRLRIAVLMAEDGLSDWLVYVRSRVRLARALAVFLPGLTCAAQIALLRLHCLADRQVSERCPPWVADPDAVPLLPFAGIALLAAYVVLVGLHAGLRAWNPLASTYPGIWRPPRTHKQKRLKRYAKARGITDGGHATPRANLIDTCCGTGFISFALFVGLALVISYGTPAAPVVAVAALGFGFAALSAWAWWRTTRTYMEYLWAISLVMPDQPAAAPSVGK